MAVDFSKVPSPAYVLDEQLFRRNLSLIRDIQERSGAEIILAFKGFAMWKAFPIVKEYIKGATASSLNEARLSYEEMSAEAHTYAPVYDPEEFPEIIRCSSHITFNSLGQFNRLFPLIKQSGKKISVGLRVNPGYSTVKTDLYNPCAPGSRLGIPAEFLKNGLPSNVKGLHFHNLCESAAEDLQATLVEFEKGFGHLIKDLEWINMGGGHLMTRKGYDTDLLVETIRKFREKNGLKVILEPGAAFAWETGYLVSTVLDLVENNGIRNAMLNVSFTAHMPDCLEMPYKPRILNSYKGGEKPYSYRMGGNSCLAGDYMGEWGFEKELQVGDRVIFADMIHYTMVKTTTFNGVAHPSIGMWTEKGEFQEFKKFGYEDYKNRLS